MIYSLSFNIEGVYGPGGYAHENLKDVVDFTKPLANVALDQLDDAASEAEWFDLAGEDADPRVLLESDDPEQVEYGISQISDALKSKGLGHLDISVHDNLIALVEDQDVLSWCSAHLMSRIESLQKEQRAILESLAHEWSEV